MQEIKNSILLEKLLDNAKELKAGKKGTLTAERFMLAVFDFILGKVSVEEMPAQKTLSDVVSKNTIKLTEFRDYLLDYVSKQDKVSITDNIYIQNKILELKFSSKDKSVKEITPEMLLESILRDPTKTISEFITNEKGEKSQTEDAENELTEEMDQQRLADQKQKRKRNLPRDFIDKEESMSVLEKLTDKVKDTRKQLLGAVLGQNHAVNTFISGYFQSELLAATDKKRSRPRATFLFAGPPGVGKTFLAQKAAEILALPFRSFDMSGYSDKESALEFAGSDKVYKNGSAGNVTSFVAEHPQCVLLFDEIEKAHLNVIHLFLQILDAGRLRDSFTDQEVSFTDAILIFTTNAGKRLYTQSDTTDFSMVSRKVILKALEKDVNPETGAPFFPAAICSRFASGNVIMFNHIDAHDLREIAKKEIIRHKRHFEEELHINIDIDERIFSALLFAEGGRADARTIRSRGENFFFMELFELLRLIKTASDENTMSRLEKIKFTLDLSAEDSDIADLFVTKEKPNVVAICEKKEYNRLRKKLKSSQLHLCEDTNSIDEIVRNYDVQIVAIDLRYGKREQSIQCMNAEDIDSTARDLLWHVRDHYPDIPVYIIQEKDWVFNEEERISFFNSGVRGFLEINGSENPDEKLRSICDAVYQQKSVHELAKANKVLSFETAQISEDEGRTAEIRVFDFSLATAIDAEDGDNILSNISKPNTNFSQVIGAEDAKKELLYFVDYLKNPKRFIGTGVRAPKGVILYGPPGTGKTLLAKAMANESDVTFITAEGNQFLQKYVGEGKERVHELFRIARRYAPSIIFVDEIDAIAKERRGGGHAEANGEDVLTAFLAEMDGFKSDPSRPVFVLAATNFDVQPGSEKSLDAALLRRFDRKIFVDLPTKDERIRYLKMKIADNAVFEVTEAEIENLAIRSTGTSLAELENVLEMALRDAVRTATLKVDDDVLENAFETYMSGEEKKWDSEQLKRVARHEAGHTFLCWETGEKPSYVTIVSRADHGGYMQHGDHEGKAIYTKKELLARIRVALGGRAAEIVYYGEEDGLSTGASGDLKTATAIAKQIVCSYGMDANLGMAPISTQEIATGEIANEIKESINSILEAEMEKAIDLILNNREKLDRLVADLLTKNHLIGKEIDAIFSDNKYDFGG